MKALQDILYRVPLVERRGPLDAQVAGLTADSRQVRPGALFVAVRGTQADGHHYISQALAAGACAVVCEALPEALPEGVPVLRVADAAEALGWLAANFYDNPSENLIVVGVTGTNGKTTIATLLFELFTAMGFRCGLLSTVNVRIGAETREATHTTPDAVSIQHTMAEMLDAQCAYVFMEVSSHAAHQKRIAGIRFDAGIFSNITHDHLDYHGTFSNYIRAKQSFFDQLGPEAFALTNLDDKNGEVMLQNTRARRVSYAIRHIADHKGKVLEKTFEGLWMNLDGHEAYFRLTGTFNAYNLLAVYSAAVELGQEPEAVLTALSELGPVRGRFQVMRFAPNYTAIVDYAHTPDALANVLRTIHEIHAGQGRVLTVVGCGGGRDRAKRPEMARLAAAASDLVVLTSDNPRTEDPEAILAEMLAGVPVSEQRKVLRIANRREAIRTAAHLALHGDVLLVAGKGHEAYQEILGVKHPFDDAAEVRAAFLNLQNPTES